MFAFCIHANIHWYKVCSWGLRRIWALGDCPGSLQLQPIPIHRHQHQRWNCSRWSRSHPITMACLSPTRNITFCIFWVPLRTGNVCKGKYQELHVDHDFGCIFWPMTNDDWCCFYFFLPTAPAGNRWQFAAHLLESLVGPSHTEQATVVSNWDASGQVYEKNMNHWRDWPPNGQTK